MSGTPASSAGCRPDMSRRRVRRLPVSSSGHCRRRRPGATTSRRGGTTSTVPGMTVAGGGGTIAGITTRRASPSGSVSAAEPIRKARRGDAAGFYLGPSGRSERGVDRLVEIDIGLAGRAAAFFDFAELLAGEIDPANLHIGLAEIFAHQRVVCVELHRLKIVADALVDTAELAGGVALIVERLGGCRVLKQGAHV